MMATRRRILFDEAEPGRKFVKFGSMKVYVVKNNIENEKADVIVCSAHRSLNLRQGHAAKSLDKASGNSLQKECSRNYPNGIKNGEIAVINVGNLSCKNVYFITLPKFDYGNVQKLRKVTHQCLELANRYMHKSIAIPALGTGYLGYPAETVATTMFDCAKDFSSNTAPLHLQTVTIIVHPSDKETWKMFKSEARSRALGSGISFETHPFLSPHSNSFCSKYNREENSDFEFNPGELEVWENQENTYCGEQHPSSHKRMVHTHKNQFDSASEFPASIRWWPRPKFPLQERSKHNLRCSSRGLVAETGLGRKFVKFGNLKVYVVKDNLEHEEADVIVCSAHKTLDLSQGRTVHFLDEASGNCLQNECSRNYPNGITNGEIAVIEASNLGCQNVYFITLPKWNSIRSVQKLRKVTHQCLELANRYMHKSMAIPALGTGYLGYPAETVATTMFDCIEDFSSNTASLHLQTVTIVVHPSDKKTWKKFRSEARSRSRALASEYQVLQRPQARLSRRGSREYFVDMYKSDTYPPCYWTRYKDSKSIKEWNADIKEPTKPLFIPVDQDTLSEIKKVVELTWQVQFVGYGKDAKGLQELNYTKIRVTKVERVENIDVFEKYAHYRQTVFKKAAKQGQVTPFNDIKCLKKGPLMTTAHISGSSVLTKDIYPEINEHYLFHGTKEDLVYSIASQGLDDRLAENTMFGKGVYCAESSTKADQYADDKQNRSDGIKKMFLVRACLGHVLIETTSKVYQRPPCRKCKQDKCTDHDNVFYDCVVGEGSWNFREFVFYDGAQVYPEYLVTYRRA